MLWLAPDRHQRRTWRCRGDHTIRPAGARRMRLTASSLRSSPATHKTLSSRLLQPAFSRTPLLHAGCGAEGPRLARYLPEIAPLTLALLLLLLSATMPARA